MSFGPGYSFLIIAAASITLGACSSRPQLPLVIKEPSELDPKNPPSIALNGLENGDLIAKGKEVKLKYSVKNFPVGENYQKLVMRLNDLPPVILSNAKGTIDFDKGLKPGVNIFRAYLVRSWGESIKVPSANLVRAFYFSDRVGVLPAVDSLPVLTLVSPGGNYTGELSKKILFDFLIQGNPKAAGKIKNVRYSLNGTLRELGVGKAVYFEHLPPGTYNLQIDLTKKMAVGGAIDLGFDRASFVISEQPTSD